jgi:hypothetical protein
MDHHEGLTKYQRMLAKYNRDDFTEHIFKVLPIQAEKVLKAWRAGSDEDSKWAHRFIQATLREMERRLKEDWWRFR